ncbi:KilA-N domain-containing protein [Acinetobacter chengduensis]|uniref:KilA-N domain-containing protein n=1 Tax=Acinetobacter chengduensis TaxID=2420890 RepID=A0ABX9TQV9_9GAMM|nr:KilA-N domain-containing protein [Acinetobacter chengduensis]RLL16606.1 KilA-N domain-containing protein [Acinetobacter chengduensis]
MAKDRSMLVQNIQISVSTVNNEDYISLTDMVRAKDGEFAIADWLRNRNTLEFIGVWEELNNPDFNYGEFAIIKNQSGLNGFKVSVKELTEKANIISLQSKTGRYGGTFAHKDLAFEFGMWISPQFKLYLIKEFQRLKEQEAQRASVEWQVKRELSKINYRIHTDAIQEHLIQTMPQKKQGFVYASEADMLNTVVFGKTAKSWKQDNPNLKDGNQRDYASALDNLLMANLESYNSILITQGLDMSARFSALTDTANQFKQSMQKSTAMERLEDQAKPLLSEHKSKKKKK